MSCFFKLGNYEDQGGKFSVCVFARASLGIR